MAQQDAPLPTRVFSKCLPRKRFRRSLNPGIQHATESPLMTTIKGKLLLIIDDDAAMLRALSKVLTGEGARVTSACCAAEAMEHLTNKWEKFDLIITDLRMPILGGQTILAAVAVAFPEVPVIVITAFGTPDIEAQCLGQGAAAVLEKPLDTPQLLAAIERVLSASKPPSPRRARRRGAVRKLDPTAFDSQTVFLA